MENISYQTGLIEAFLDGSASREQLLELLAWLKLEKEHSHYFNQICNAWEGGNQTADNEQQTELALIRLQRRITEATSKIEIAPTLEHDPSKRYLWLARIAAVVAGIALLFSSHLYFSGPKIPLQPLQYITAITPPSQKSQLLLADGTKVWLNSGTKLQYATAYGIKTREVYLDGEAYFQVAKDASRPFLVHASAVMVKALGTSFNVKCYAEDKTIETTLIEGKVEVTGTDDHKTNEKVILKPNEMATFIKTSQTLSLSRFADVKTLEPKAKSDDIPEENMSIATVTSWKDQLLVFENETFDKLVIQLERWYDVKITVVNEKLNQNKYTGKFGNNESVEQVLKIISRTTPIHYTVNGKSITIE